MRKKSSQKSVLNSFLTPNSASLSVRLGPWVDNDTLFTPQHDSHFRTISAQFLKWLVDQDAAASCMRTVSLIELFVAFRLSREGCGPISDAEGGSRFFVCDLLPVIFLISSGSRGWFSKKLTFLWGPK